MATKSKEFILRNVRLSFPDIFEKAKYKGKPTDQYRATFLLDKGAQADQVAAVHKVLAEFLKEAFPGGTPKGLKKEQFFKDGDEVNKDGELLHSYDGYTGQIGFAASSYSPIDLRRQNKDRVIGDDGTFYAGCYVNAKVSLRYSDHKDSGNKQILGVVHAIQFVKAGESFASSNDGSGDDFDEVESTEEDMFN